MLNSKGDNNTYLRGGGEDQGGDGWNAPLRKLSSSGNKGRVRPGGGGAAGLGAPGRRPLQGCRPARGRAGAQQAPRLRTQPAGSSSPRPRRGASEGRGQAAAESRAGLRSARGGRGLPPVPALHIRGPGRAWGWPSAGESGRVFPPPLGQASERRRARPSLANPAPAAARPPAFSRGPPPGLSGPARSLSWSQRLGGKAQIRARELLRARGAERRQHGKWGAPGRGPGLGGWGRPQRSSFPSDLGQAAAIRQ